jgi:hypothetical protein
VLAAVKAWPGRVELVTPAPRRPSLTAAARGVTGPGQVGTKKRSSRRTKKPTRKKAAEVASLSVSHSAPGRPPLPNRPVSTDRECRGHCRGSTRLSTGEKRARPLAFVTGKTAAARCGGIGEAPEIDRHNWPRRHDQTLFKVYCYLSGCAAGEGNDAGEIAGRTIEAAHDGQARRGRCPW